MIFSQLIHFYNIPNVLNLYIFFISLLIKEYSFYNRYTIKIQV